MESFLQHWQNAALTSLGFFWMAFWAFALGYLISSLIQVLVTRRRMQRLMGTSGPKSMAIATFFGFISSSCSFAALSTTRALFQKGASLAPALAFMLASTNLVIELGIVIALFMSWQFVVGEYVGGLLLILFAWLFVRFFNPRRLIAKAREKLEGNQEQKSDSSSNWQEKATSWNGWQEIGKTYIMEWQMVWRDVLIGFTVAGIIAAFVPDAFFTTLFIGSGSEQAANPGFLAVLSQALVGPVAAFFTFIGSMGNIPLAALLFGHGVSFAGVMAFIFSDLVVFPVLRINATYYGWKLALYILILLLIGLVFVSVGMHYGLALLDLLPHAEKIRLPMERNFFKLDYGFYLNLLFLLISGVLVLLARKDGAHEHHGEHDHHEGDGSSATWGDRILAFLSFSALIWVTVGSLLLPLVLKV